MNKSRVAYTTLLGLIAMLLSNCGNGDQTAHEPDTEFGLTKDERIAFYHEYEFAILENENAGREEIPEGGPNTSITLTASTTKVNWQSRKNTDPQSRPACEGFPSRSMKNCSRITDASQFDYFCWKR